MSKKLHKSNERVIAGVCGGVADYLGADHTVVRLITVGLALFSGFFPLIVVYLIAAAIMPEGPRGGRKAVDDPVEGEFYERK